MKGYVDIGNKSMEDAIADFEAAQKISISEWNAHIDSFSEESTSGQYHALAWMQKWVGIDAVKPRMRRAYLALTDAPNSLPALKCGTCFPGTLTFSPVFGLWA